jgi:competence protein ComEC
MLIDTGGLINYDIANKTIMPYLNYHGIRKIDVVVVTHEDYDHCGALEELKKQIKIDKIITNQDNVENVNLGKIHLENINNYYTSDSSDNDKSIVLHGNICSLDFLFTGDISFEIENEIIKDYEYFDIDVLKVSHHGSKYSTSDEFVSHIKPEIAIISVGKNYYGHPSDEVLQILKNHNVEIYRTDQNGTIKIKGKIFDNWFIDSAK